MPHRVVRRTLFLSRVVRQVPPVASFPSAPEVKGAAESVAYLFDFTPFPEFAAGLALSSVSVPAVTGLAHATTATILTARTDGVAAGRGATVAVSGGTAGTTYAVSARGTFSNGSVREIRLSLAVA